ncbi:hypothetical protein [Bordetella petrii]|uniref:hypothetical protein n=1 Tax=Bordetella petrii TaxID=94624 RepID=UPI003733FDD2
MTRRLATLALVLAAAAVLFAMQHSTPRYEDLTGPIPVAGGMRETVRARTFDIEVERVEFARRLQYHNSLGGATLRETSGLWAVVTARLAARAESVSVTRAFWQGPTGIRYELSDRVSLVPDLPPVDVDPGLPRRGRFVFEIRPDQVGDATLLVSQGPFPLLDSQARIALDSLPLGADGALAIQDLLDMNPPRGAKP